MKINSEITPDTRFVQLNTAIVQQLIRFNKVQIKELETEKKYLQHVIRLYYNSCNPIDPYGILSSAAFICLNKSRDDLLSVKKNIKLLAAANYALKTSLR